MDMERPRDSNPRLQLGEAVVLLYYGHLKHCFSYNMPGDCRQVCRSLRIVPSVMVSFCGCVTRAERTTETVSAAQREPQNLLAVDVHPAISRRLCRTRSPAGGGAFTACLPNLLFFACAMWLSWARTSLQRRPVP